MSAIPATADESHAPASIAACSSFIRHEPDSARPAGADYRPRLHALAARQRRVARGAELIRQGDSLSSLYEIHAGQFKTCMTDTSGRCQITGFHMTGELLGLDGIAARRHGVAAVALEDALVFVIPYDDLNRLFKEFATLQHEFHLFMGREIVRAQALMLLLGSLAAEGRIVAFLLDLIGRLQARGYSSSELVLRMSREEIGSSLGLQLETVSRTLSRLHSIGVLEVSKRCIHVRDEVTLHRILQGPGGQAATDPRGAVHCGPRSQQPLLRPSLQHEEDFVDRQRTRASRGHGRR